jgi:hypothetical protein
MVLKGAFSDFGHSKVYCMIKQSFDHVQRTNVYYRIRQSSHHVCTMYEFHMKN